MSDPMTPRPEGEMMAMAWIAGSDTGVSSKAIWRHMMGVQDFDEWSAFGTHPSDPDDFGRCYRLLKLIPAWRPRIAEMAWHSTQWAALVAVWDELEAMYEREVDRSGPRHRGNAVKLYERMQGILYPKVTTNA